MAVGFHQIHSQNNTKIEPDQVQNERYRFVILFQYESSQKMVLYFEAGAKYYFLFGARQQEVEATSELI